MLGSTRLWWPVSHLQTFGLGLQEKIYLKLRKSEVGEHQRSMSVLLDPLIKPPPNTNPGWQRTPLLLPTSSKAESEGQGCHHHSPRESQASWNLLPPPHCPPLRTPACLLPSLGLPGYLQCCSFPLPFPPQQERKSFLGSLINIHGGLCCFLKSLPRWKRYLWKWLWPSFASEAVRLPPVGV